MRRTASIGIIGLVLMLAGCKGAAYQPYNGPNGAAEQPVAAEAPAAAKTGGATKPAPAPAPEPEPEPAPEVDQIAMADVAKKVKASIRLTSRSFANGGSIPSTFTCDGFDGSPDLAWNGIPPGTVELAVTMEDRKAPHGGFTHWTLFGLKPSLSSLPAGRLPPGAHQGINDFNQAGYGGPCPGYTDGTRRYLITLYALRTRIPLTDGVPPNSVRDQIDGSAIAKGRLTGTYRRRSS